MNCKWDWKLLDKELIESYRTCKLKQFLDKYNMSNITAHIRLRKLKVSKNSRKGSNNAYWKGGKYINKNGYVMVLIGIKQYKAEHILVMEKLIGRKLLPDEIVHHKDESFEARSNNDPSNLVLTDRSNHAAHHGIKNKYWGINISKENKGVGK